LQFHVSDSQLIVHIIESIGLTYQYNRQPVNSFIITSSGLKELCKEQVLDDHIRLLDTKQKKGIQYLGKEKKYTNHITLLLGLALKNSLAENPGQIHKLAEQLGYYIGLLSEYASKKGYRRLANNEAKNFIFIISALLHECTNTEKMAIRNYKKETIRVINTLLIYVFQIAEEINGTIKEILKKVFGSNKHKTKQLIENTNLNEDEDNAELDIRYKMIYEENSAFQCSFSRLSETSLDILRNDLKNENRVILGPITICKQIKEIP